MSDQASGRKVDNELASRLDTLFDENAADATTHREENPDPLDELKSLVMSIEWEITDDLMERLVAKVETLKDRYQDDRILLMFLQLLGSLGLYVKTNKGNAHPAAFSLLSSVYASFASAAAPSMVTTSQKKKLLYNELNKYKELKEQVGLGRHPAKEPMPKKNSSREASGRTEGESTVPDRNSDQPNNSAPGDPSASVTPQQFEMAMAAIKQLIRDEFKRLRDALVE